jgi:purine-binding chemotaxis protein CheW
MDIAKIRKKALSKEAAERDKPVEKLQEKPVPVPAEDEKEPVAVEECEAPPEEISENAAAGGDEVLPDILDTDGVSSEDAVEMVELLTFSLSNEEYAFRVPEVEEVIRSQLIAFVPTMPGYVLGITSLRGKIIPVIDLKTRLNLQEKYLAGDSPEAEVKSGQEKKILIIDGPKGLIGATIDKVIGVVRLPLSEILQPPGHLDENGLKFIEGIVVLKKRFISIIHSGAAMDIEIG